MDTVQITLLLAGIGICLIPLEWVQDTVFDKSVPPTLWTLLVPFVGIAMAGVALVSYHKDALRSIFYGVCKTVEQTGFGISLAGLTGGTTASMEGFVPASEAPHNAATIPGPPSVTSTTPVA